MKLFNYLSMTRIFFNILIFFTFLVFYFLSLNWDFTYRILFSIIPVLLFIFLVKSILKLPLENINSFINQNRLIKLITLIVTLLIIFIILLFYKLPDYFYIVLFVFTLIFFYSSYYVIYFISIITIFFTFLIFQFFYFEQKIALDLLEYQNYQNIKKQILEYLDYKIENNKVIITSKNDSSTILIKIPDNFEMLNSNEQVFNFPLIYMGKPKNQELPIFSCFIIKKNYPFTLLDLRIQSFLLDLKKISRIDDFNQLNNPFLSSLYKDIEIYNQFFVFFDRFYAENIQIGYYAIPFDQFYIILWIRETQKKGFPHDKYILEILNSLAF